ncbi:hypothetical protein QWI17_16935 [Gilvimarinus sp. SDUM040013]|uniref:Addiction module killer protein n=1 Tax=Gilvimarinus gilvus TaxID=3058038 RepID=A0ABU4S2Y9_9GAMM|nr:type II toxin-antitoxin system RelE/ParE family toxin [Gilvimarinus sp. SDUM040013]MDO3387530.1 hypothetical protein [Gilvimarinus sp. SDUM040013]MDX6851520.1 hypothetical protein [Gilvimarinus sp. SDUM040013]
MVKPVIQRRAEEYVSADGHSPFRSWLIGITDGRAKAKVTKAIKQMEAGNFGDHKAITDSGGLKERRINYGSGYRIYYITEGSELIILFAGSCKADQQTSINAAKKYLLDYKSRKAR